MNFFLAIFFFYVLFRLALSQSGADEMKRIREGFERRQREK